MERFTKRSKDMNPKWEGIFYVTVEQKIARFIELHVNSKTNTITFTPERFKELTEYIGRTKTPIKNHNLKSLREANLIKYVWTNNSGQRVYMLNPEWSNQFSDADQEKYIDLYNKLTDGDLEHNIRIKYGNDDIEDELGDTGDNEGEEESNKSNQEPDEPKGDSKEIVHHPEAEVKVQVQGYNPVTTPEISPDQFLENVRDAVVDHAPAGIDKNRLGLWLSKGNLENLRNWFIGKGNKHAGADLNKILKLYSQPDQFSELYTIFKSGGKIKI